MGFVCLFACLFIFKTEFNPAWFPALTNPGKPMPVISKDEWMLFVSPSMSGFS